jgi:hypothetical protein
MNNASNLLIPGVLAVLGLSAPSLSAAQEQPVSLNWLEREPPVSCGVSWGVPCSRGMVRKDQSFTLTSHDGKTLPLQTWPLAYWPDGSIKWSGFATTAGPQSHGPFALAPGRAAPADGPIVRVENGEQAIEVDTGRLKCRIPRRGAYLFDSITIDGRAVGRQGRLECIVQKGPELDAADPPPRERFVSEVHDVTVEQSGPVRAVVKLTGTHRSESSNRSWLPFTVRLYFYAGEAPVRMVHSFVFDGDEARDFIRGLGLVVSVPFREEVQNRHVRFSGEGEGLWAEPIQPLIGAGGGVTYPDGGGVYNDQVAGKRVPNRKDLNARGQHLLESYAVWDDFRLIQPNAQGFTVEKRTSPQSCWLPAGAGGRSSGLVFAGDVSGGLAVGLKDFWQSYPCGLEVRHAKTDAAELRVWLWSPDAPAMDLRHYDRVAHGLSETYEDVEEGFSTPNGVARTSELTLFPCAGVPSKEETAGQVKAAVRPPLLVCTPRYLHSVRAFGIWSLQNRSTPYRRAIEDQLDANIAYYQKSIEQNNWYGFWDFGDVMHAYDGARHVWRYDVGGYAWDNSEQGTDMWLWYSFLRTGRADLFRMAEAMTRHTGEVDCYHSGRFAGLGSRHNVRHWGCGAKEARISMAPYRRFYYYLTTDERTGDIMREMLVADTKVAEVDPMRKVNPRTEDDKRFPARLRGGPDWFALVGNWLTEWERTGDVKWRDRIYAGMDSIAAMPFWFRTSQNLLWGYDPVTGKLTPRAEVLGSYNLVTNMGGPEVIFELNELIDHPVWPKIWLQYCRLSGAPGDVILKDKETGAEAPDGQYAGAGRMAAYVYRVTNNPAYARRALEGLSGGRGAPQIRSLRRVEGPQALKPIDEAVGVSPLLTNGVNQSSLNMIEVLEMCADQLPEN